MLDEQRQARFTRVWTAAQPAVTAYVRAIVRDPHVTHDIVQATALVLLQKFAQWDSDREFLPWALGFAKMTLLSHRRDAGRSRVVFDDAILDAVTAVWPSATTEVQREQTVLPECLDTLAPKARELVRLRYYEDLTSSEAAERTGLTPSAVRVALLRIRRTLSDCVTRRLNSSERNS